MNLIQHSKSEYTLYFTGFACLTIMINITILGVESYLPTFVFVTSLLGVLQYVFYKYFLYFDVISNGISLPLISAVPFQEEQPRSYNVSGYEYYSIRYGYRIYDTEASDRDTQLAIDRARFEELMVIEAVNSSKLESRLYVLP